MSKKRERVPKTIAAGDARTVFTEAIRQLEDQNALVDSCVEGLGLLLGKAKELRIEYLKNTHKLEVLRRQIKEEMWNT